MTVSKGRKSLYPTKFILNKFLLLATMKSFSARTNQREKFRIGARLLYKYCKNYKVTSYSLSHLITNGNAMLVIKFFFVSKWLEGTPLLLLVFLLTSHCKAQAPPLVFRNFTVNDGLSHNFVRGFLQDSRGFMWVATIDGLNKFDGYTFKTYKVKRNDTTSVSSNNISALAEDHYGNIWAGTWGGGICVYNRKSDNFTRIGQSGSQGRAGFPSKFI